MVSPQHDDGVFRQVILIERVEDASELSIHVADSRVIAMDQMARLGIMKAVPRKASPMLFLYQSGC